MADGALNVSVDVETTGLDPRRDRVVQVALAYRELGSGRLRSWSTLCHPGAACLARGAASGAFRINRRRDVDFVDAPLTSEAAAALRTQLAGLETADRGPPRIRCYNLPFDRAFLTQRPWSVPGPWGACVMRLAHARLNPTGKWPSLREAATRLGIRFDAERAHDAEYDARLTLLVLEGLEHEAADAASNGLAEVR